jgi:hypothetical protein
MDAMEGTPSHPQPLLAGGPAGQTETRSALQEIYLQRLQRLLRLRRQHEQDLNQHGVRLLDHSIFAAYCDCRDLGAGTRARGILSAANYDVGPDVQSDVQGAA